MPDQIETPTLTREAILELPDPNFTEDTVAVVTGAASGIGRATAVALAVNGLTVIGMDIDESGLGETADKADELDAAGTVQPAPGNVADEAEVAATIEAAGEHGDLRYLANIAGLQHVSPLASFPVEAYDRLMDAMVKGPFLLSKHALQEMRETDDAGGVIANMSSVHGHYVTRDKAAYNTAKFALRGLTQSIAAEGDGQIRSFSVSVGYVKTPLVVNQIADSARERGITEREVVEDVMLGQARTTEMMDPIEVANLFTFGCSTFARHLNGGDLLFDGGYALTYE